MKSFTKMFMMLLMLCAAGASYADENVIYVQDAEIPVEEVQEVAQTIELSIWMKNTAPIRGFEFDMYLPEVISVKKNNKGRIQGVKFNAGRLPEDDEHTLTLSELSDGAVHFVCGSMYDETFTGNDGEIMIMEVNLSANVAVGNYPIQLKNIKLTETNPSNYYETELMESVFRVTGEPSLPNVVHDGTYYVMSAQEGTLINAENALDAKGVPITFTFSNNAYTIEGADFFNGKQWTVAEAFEGLSGYYTISNTDGFVAVSATNTLEQIADGTADAAIWILLQKTYWEDIINSTYTIAGTKNLTGTENDWDFVDANQMVYNEETGLYEKKFEGVVIENGNQPEFKVVQTNMEGNKIWYPNGDNWVITTSYVGGEGIYDITIIFDPSDLKEIGVDAVKTGDITKNTYTATFKTNLVWESVYAYAWSGDGDTAVKFLGDWPGTKVTDVDDSHDDYDIYTLTFEASKAPEKIIFSNGVGGKVGRTQTADLEFVDGKEYSLIYVRSDLMEYAIQLADSADEGEALNKLLEAIQYAYENDDESQLQAAIDQFIADTEKANYFIEFTAGKYYIIDAETGMMMAAGGSFGTHGIVNERGLDLWLTPYTESRTVTIDSRVSGGVDSHFLSQNLFMDSEEWGWGLVYQGFGFYIKDPNSGKYINIDEDNNLVLSDTPHEWIIVTAEGVREQRMEELAEATIDNPVDATFLITAPNFNRNDQRNAEAWNVSGDCTLSTGNEVNNCAESLHSTFTISQTLAGAPKGTYRLTAQGFYRQDDGASEAAPQFFIGSKMVQLPKLTGSEANASDASASFTNGLYTIDPITFYYDGTGDLTIGIQGTAEHQWVVFDNFCLTYLDPEKYEVYTEFDEATGTLTYYYDYQMASRSGVTEVYDPVGNPDAARFTGYYKKVLKAVIDPSMKNANLTSMYSMFFGGINNETFAFQTLSKMTEIKGMENLNTADVTRMDFMFEACNALKTVDVSSFDISKVTKMDFMFGDCYELTTIYCSKDWSSTSASSDNMFGACRKLVGGNGTAFDSNVTNATYARPDGGTASPGYFTAGVVGDVNGDGEVNLADAQTILGLMAKDEYKTNADVNNDSSVDLADYQTVLGIMAKQ